MPKKQLHTQNFSSSVHLLRTVHHYADDVAYATDQKKRSFCSALKEKQKQ